MIDSDGNNRWKQIKPLLICRLVPLLWTIPTVFLAAYVVTMVVIPRVIDVRNVDIGALAHFKPSEFNEQNYQEMVHLDIFVVVVLVIAFIQRTVRESISAFTVLFLVLMSWAVLGTVVLDSFLKSHPQETIRYYLLSFLPYVVTAPALFVTYVRWRNKHELPLTP